MNRSNGVLHIEDLSKLTSLDIEDLCQVGFCYIKIDEDLISAHLAPIRDSIFSFFKRQDLYKENYNFSSKSLKSPKFASQGYLKRRTNRSSLETFRQRLDMELISPLDRFEGEVIAIKNIFLQGIGKRLLEKIISSLLEETQYTQEDYFSELTFWAQFVYYPHQSFFERIKQLPGLHVHRDISYGTMIFLEKKGLRIWRDGFWQDILPKPGYAVFLIGSDLAAITNNQVLAPLHYVSMSNIQYRLSSVFFISPNRSKPLYSVSGVKLHDANMSLIDRDRQDSEDIISISTFFTKIKISINLLFLPIIISNLDFSYADVRQIAFTNFFKFILSFLSLNLVIKLFDFLYLDRLKIDYLQHSKFPTYASHDQLEAYDLGKSSLTFFGFSKSLLNKSTYENRSFWNAGLLGQLVKK